MEENTTINGEEQGDEFVESESTDKKETALGKKKEMCE